MPNEKDPSLQTQCVIRNVMLSYVYLLEPRDPDENGEGKYSCMILIKKSDDKQVEAVKAAIKNACKAGLAKFWGNKKPAKLASPLRDGDAERPDDPDVAGCWFMNASSRYAPGIYNKYGGRKITKEDGGALLHSGMICHVDVNFFAYAKSGNNGVACGLNNVLYVAEGKYLGGKKPGDLIFAEDIIEEADDAFGPSSEGMSAAATATSQPKAEAEDDDWDL